MKCQSSKIIVFLTLFTLLLSGGCSKRIVDVTDSGTTDNNLSSGTDINYPPAGYSEEGLPREGTLDDISPSPPSTNYMETTGEMTTAGRTSSGMQPIYFQFDQSTIPESMMTILQQNANFLKENPSLYVVVEGNCDERGAKEYNLALGERRALNTKNFLTDLGIHENRIRTVSYGEERPADMGNNEHAWAQNRRVDFVTE